MAINEQNKQLSEANKALAENKPILLSSPIYINMDKQVAGLISKEKPTLSEMSVKTYANCISKVLELLKTDKYEALYTDPHKVIKLLNQHYEKSNTIKMKLSSIIVFLRIIKTDKTAKAIDAAIEVYGGAIELLATEIKAALSSSEKSTKQKENWLQDDDVAKLNDTLLQLVPKDIRTPKDLLHLRNYVIFKLYQTNPTRNEVADSKIIFKPLKKDGVLSDEYNYVVLDKKTKTITYVMNQYKTFKSYGQKNVDIDKGLYPLFLQYKKAVDMFNDKHWFLLNDSATDKMTRNRLGVVYSALGASIGKKLGTSQNRHITLSNLIPIQKMKEMANKMANSVGEQVAVYAKA